MLIKTIMTSWVEYLKVGGASTTDLDAPLIEDCREPERNTNNYVHICQSTNYVENRTIHWSFKDANMMTDLST